MPAQRIEYIDAMRGFTMLLVVYSHICAYCLGDRSMGFNDVFFLFRLPCFFFISGWLFCRPERQWDLPTVKSVVSRKFMVQIVPTFIFLLLLAPPPLFFSRLGALKGGYWFTFALFVFFLLTIFSERCLRRWGLLFAVGVSVAAFCYDVFYHHLYTVWQSPVATATSGLLGFIGFMTWRYYLFFFLGTLAKRHFDAFTRLTSSPAVMTAVVAGFALTAMVPHTDSVTLAYCVFAVGGVLGMTAVFAFFRTFAALFSRQSAIGRILQHIGTRTLDIYLLHYFVLPRFLLPHAEPLRTSHQAWLELVVAFLLASGVVAVCLFLSWVIRLSPVLGHYLFGVKYEKGK